MATPFRARRLTSSLTVGTAVAVLVGVLAALHAFDAFENAVWDLRERTMAAPSPVTPEIDVILLDQSSLDWAEENQGLSWPWPREMFAAIVDFVTRADASALVLDVIFDQPSPLAGDDAAFARSIKANGRVVLAEAIKPVDGGWTGSPPTPELAAAARTLGHVSSIPDADGVNRRVLPRVKLVESELPSLSVRAAELLGHPAPLGDESILRYRGPFNTHKVYSAAQILNSEIQLRSGEAPQIDPSALKGHTVFFGYSAPGLLDLRPSPMDNRYPGVLVHATALDNLLAGDGLRRAPWWVDGLLILGWAWLAAAAVSWARRAVFAAPVFLAAAALPVAAGWVAYAAGWWWPVVSSAVSSLGAGVAMMLVNYALEGQRNRFLRSAFKQYLSPAVIERLVADPDQLKLGGEKRNLSIFFSDVAGFTSISERLKDDPEALTALLNDYLSEMTSIIYAHGGTIDKYEGDAIIAFWNAPVDLPDHAEQAVRASLACQAKLLELAPRLSAAAGRPFTARIGLNTGFVVVGNMGSEQRFNYTFLGDAGNLASRLEGINKLFGTQLLVSEFTKAGTGVTNLCWREIGRVRVVGKELPVTVYEPMLPESYQPLVERLTAFDRALRAWYRGAFDEALAGFEAWPEDSCSQRYAEKTRELLAAPPENWQGVWTATEK